MKWHAGHLHPNSVRLKVTSSYYFCINLVELPDPALLPSPVNDVVYVRAILPTSLRPSINTPSAIPAAFPRFPPKYTYSFTPSYPPRAVDPEAIRTKAVNESSLLEESLAKLVAAEAKGEVTEARHTGKEGRAERDEVWWETWKEMGCDLDRNVAEIWQVGDNKRGVAGST